jgi:murein L,D-transpeptidase YafK
VVRIPVTMRLVQAVILTLSAGVSAFAAEDKPIIDQVVVYKNQRRMVLLAQGKEIKSYRVALGGEPIGPKQRQGDHRTPEGSYVLDSQNLHSQFYKAFHISYPNSQDIAAAKKRGVNPGGAIMLHGLPKEYAWVGKAHTNSDWTDGCIAVTNEEMDEIWKIVRPGTPIDIRP